MEILPLIARNFIVMDGSMSHNGGSYSRQQSATFQSQFTPRSRRHSYDKGSRRNSLGDCNAAPTKPTRQRTGLYRSTSVADFKTISWSEYTARRSLVKFRNRRSASARSRDDHGGIPPSKLAVRVLCSQYEVCRDGRASVSERLMAVFYCWFFGRITDVYNALTVSGTEKSFTKWCLSCLLVTTATMLLLAIVAVTTRGVLLVAFSILQSAVTFSAFVLAVFICILSSSTILSYSRRHWNSADNGRHKALNEL